MEKVRDRIRGSIHGAALASLIMFGVLVVGFLYLAFSGQYKAELRNELMYVGAAFDSGIETDAFLEQLGPVTSRLTLVDIDGTVLYDSEADEGDMENHLLRPEIDQAMQTGEGYATRFSATLGKRTYYYALRLDSGAVVRLSGTQNSVLGMLPSMLLFFFAVCLVLLPITLTISDRLTSAIVQPINRIHLDDLGADDCAYEELVPLFERIKSQRMQIDRQMRELTARQREFSIITETMNEGLIVLNSRSEILTINRSAAELFRLSEQSDIGRPLGRVCADEALSRVVAQAEAGGTAREIVSQNERVFQLIANPVRSAGHSTGVVVLVPDVTDQIEAERQRRDFSANVSHELKTPLTSILGFAEIMANGFAPEADMRGFAGRIHEEAARLLTLIDDIIHLSRLDEQAGLPESEPVNLLELAESVAGYLKSRAEARHIALTVQGDAAMVRGIRPVLSEMTYNLVDNAIKYNIDGGSVWVSVSQMESVVELVVADTGIGIAPEHQEHIFERFYRVDKSHSRDVGGTGLGLSIVKHGMLLHEARVSVESSLGKGTTIRVQFPLKKKSSDEA